VIISRCEGVTGDGALSTPPDPSPGIRLTVNASRRHGVHDATSRPIGARDACPIVAIPIIAMPLDILD
jgi:hypothetical protein